MNDKIFTENDEPIKYISLPPEMINKKETSIEGIYAYTLKVAAQIVQDEDKLIYDQVFKWAKANGYTDIYLINEEFVRTAFEREIERRRKKRWWNKRN